MITPPSSIAQELQKLNSEGSLLYLLEILYPPNSSLDIYLARNHDNVTWNGKTWSQGWFEIDTVNQDSDNIMESYVRMSNIGGFIENEIILRNNLKRCKMTIYCVNSNLLELNEPVYSLVFDIMKVACDNIIASAKISVQNPLLLDYPSLKYNGSICQYRIFPGDPRCPYVGVLTTCNRTIENCRERWGVGAGIFLPFGGQLSLLGETQDVTTET